MRLLVKQNSSVRRVANVEITQHDGSIILSLVRSGTNQCGWSGDSTGNGFEIVHYAEPKSKTKRITIHASGRVNYHIDANPGINFIPCLLDLVDAVPIAVYLVPEIAALDSVDDTQSDDHVINLDARLIGSFGFKFYAIPFNMTPLANEIWRFIVEGHYGLACVLLPSPLTLPWPRVPLKSFSIVRPTSLLPQQATPEDQAFIRFQALMHMNQVRKMLASSEIKDQELEEIADAIVRNGRGIQGPNNIGIWEVVCNVPMRTRPELIVNFSDTRYHAQMIDMTPLDKRLDKVRVRFKVYDQQATRWVKHPVEILRVFLNAEL